MLQSPPPRGSTVVHVVHVQYYITAVNGKRSAKGFMNGISPADLD